MYLMDQDKNLTRLFWLIFDIYLICIKTEGTLHRQKLKEIIVLNGWLGHNVYGLQGSSYPKKELLKREIF